MPFHIKVDSFFYTKSNKCFFFLHISILNVVQKKYLDGLLLIRWMLRTGSIDVKPLVDATLVVDAEARESGDDVTFEQIF